MNPQSETLTPKQQRVFAAIIALIILSFSSVFVYAYARGLQAQATRLDQAERMWSLQTRRNATVIPRGTRGQANNILFRTLDQTSSWWSICQIPEYSPTRPHTAAPNIAYSSYPNEWHVKPTGVVEVPAKAKAGLYLLQCARGDFLFEVVPAPAKGAKSSSKAFPGNVTE